MEKQNISQYNFQLFFHTHCEFLSTNPKHERVHFFLNVLMAHAVAIFIRGLQQHV